MTCFEVVGKNVQCVINDLCFEMMGKINPKADGVNTFQKMTTVCLVFFFSFFYPIVCMCVCMCVCMQCVVCVCVCAM